VVAGGDDHEQHERRVEHPEHTDCEVPAAPEQARGDDQRVADVHAGDGGVRVVERADQTVVEVDRTVRDGVGDPDPGQARRRRRVDEEADEGEAAREQERGADERERRRAPLVEPDQHHDRDREMHRQVEDAEHARHVRERLDSALYLRLEEDMQRPLEPGDPMSVLVGFGGVAHDQAACDLVEGVQGQNDGRLDRE
jgi:hypothetical protein